jgi:protocatechuate 3,4-dioxygenase beta subunit
MSELDGPLITRRRGLSLLGTAGAGALVAAATGGGGSAAARSSLLASTVKACTLTAEQEVGPYYVAYDKVREDIVGAAVGLPLELEITVISSLTCKPIKNAAVDLWQCDALGVYSSESSEDTVGKTFLRGVQFTDKLGQVTFKAIYPGHYAGRTTHIHAKVHIASRDDNKTLIDGHVSHIGQMFPSDAVNTEVYKLSPYTDDTIAIVTHAEDRVWTQQHGPESQITIKKVGNRLAKGLTGTITLAVNPKAVPAAVGVGAGGGTGTTTPPGGSTTTTT